MAGRSPPIVAISAQKVGLSDMLEAVPDAVIAVDAAGLVVVCNSHAADLFGYEMPELLGQPVEALLPPRFRTTHHAHRAGFAAAGSRRLMGEGMELLALHRGGRELEVEVALNPVSLDGQPATMAIIRDVADRRRLMRALVDSEEQLKHANAALEQRIAERTVELREANHELEAFSYSVAHDLRAPLRQIAGFARLLDEDLGENLSPDTARHLNHIRSGTNQMSRLITDLLDLAHISRRALAAETTDLGGLVRAVIEDLAPACRDRTIEWRIGELPLAICDASLVHVAFSNLLANAIKFTEPRPLAVIEVGVVVGSEPPTLFVRDNGVGFDMRYADKLFGVFQRLHSDEEFPGTGIGLATVQRVVRRHRGRVWASATLGEGATFYFTLEDPIA